MRSLTLVLLAICIYGLAGLLKLLFINKKKLFKFILFKYTKLNIAHHSGHAKREAKRDDGDELPWADDDELHDVLRSHDHDALSEYLANHRLTDEQREYVDNFDNIEWENSHNNQAQSDDK